MISKTGLHAIKALAALAELPEGSYAGSGQVAREIGARQNYLGKLLQLLSHHGLVNSQKGQGGGFRLARDAREISLLEVLEPIDHVSRWNGCFMGNGKCLDESPCSIHHRWALVRDAYLNLLMQTSIADLSGRRPLEAGALLEKIL